MQDVSVLPASKVKAAFDKLDQAKTVSEAFASCADYLEQTADHIDHRTAGPSDN
jgi:hypothetical protein